MKDTRLNEEVVSAFYAAHGAQMDAVNQAIMARECDPVRHIYLDLCLFKDTRMGLLFSLADESLKQMLLDGLKRYNSRFDRKFLSAYPKFPYTEEQLNQMYRDPKRSEEIFDYAPDTLLSYLWEKYMRKVLQQNKISNYQQPVLITINAYPLTVTKDLMFFASALSRLSRGAFKTTVISVDPRYVGEKLWAQQDWLFIDDLSQLCQEGTSWYWPFFNGKFLAKTVFMPPCLTEGARRAWIKEGLDPSNYNVLSTKCDITTTVLSLYCDCICTPIPIPDPNQPVDLNSTIQTSNS